MKKKMKESEAWRILAEEFEAHRAGRFLCFALEGWQLEGWRREDARLGAIPVSTATKMQRRIREALGGSAVAYYSQEVPDLDEQHAGRVTACLLFAAQADYEDKENRDE